LVLRIDWLTSSLNFFSGSLLKTILGSGLTSIQCKDQLIIRLRRSGAVQPYILPLGVVIQPTAIVTLPPLLCNLSEPGLPELPFCGQISEIRPHFKLVGRTIFGLVVSLFLGRFLKVVWQKIFSVGRF